MNLDKQKVFKMVILVYRVLLRVRLLYYIKQEVIGDQAVKVFKGVPAR